MEILQTVVVKQVLTEKSKKELVDKFQRQKIQQQKECDQLRFEQKRLEKSERSLSSSFKAYFDKELDKRKEKIKLIDFQIEQLHMLPLGSEIKERELQSIVEVKVGDKWDEAILTKTIVVKEGIVTEIR